MFQFYCGFDTNGGEKLSKLAFQFTFDVHSVVVCGTQILAEKKVYNLVKE